MSFPLGKCSSSRSKGPAGFTASGLCQWTDRKGLPSQKKTSKILGGGGWVGLETFVAGGENLGGGPLGVGKTPEQRRELVTLPGTVLGGWKASPPPPPRSGWDPSLGRVLRVLLALPGVSETILLVPAPARSLAGGVRCGCPGVTPHPQGGSVSVWAPGGSVSSHPQPQS